MVVASSGVKSEVRASTLDGVVDAFNPREEDADAAKQLAAFGLAQNVVRQVLQASVGKAVAAQEAERYFAAHDHQQDPIMELPTFMPWQGAAIKRAHLKCVYFPRSKTQDFIALQVPVSLGSLIGRFRFPKAWGGLSGKELQDACGEPSAVFCHNSGFMLVAKDREGVRRLIQRAIELSAPTA
jgi:uncharacterized UPF0160 family protein